MSKRNIIVIGASAGGLEPIKTIVSGLPKDFDASIFIVWHMSPNVKGLLPQILSKLETLPATNAQDDEQIKPGRIYIAPPDYHLLLEDQKLKVTRGPKENRFRPAVDPLFRSAAYSFGRRVVGVILSGALDDGTAGLWSVKHFGGTTIVQDPQDAEVPSMPEHAMREVAVDHCVSATEIAGLLVRLTNETIPENEPIMKDDQTKREIDIASEQNAFNARIMEYGLLTPFTCPECHGVLSQLRNDNIVRYRCHTGHAYSVDTLMASITERVEDSLYSAIRGMDESIILLNHIGDHLAEVNEPRLAALYFKKAKEVNERSELIRKAVSAQEQLTTESLRTSLEAEDSSHN